MTFKKFSNWCNDRAADGCWGLQEAVICCGICDKMYNTIFFKRKKKWQELEPVAVEIVRATNAKIKEVLGVEVEDEI